MVRGKGGFIYNKSKIMENLAKVLPLSQTFRPDWDREHYLRWDTTTL